MLALALCLALAACGGEEGKTVDINALADDMLAAASFGEPMNALEEDVALGLYGCAEGTSVVAYAGTVATAEELAVFDCGSVEAITPPKCPSWRKPLFCRAASMWLSASPPTRAVRAAL